MGPYLKREEISVSRLEIYFLLSLHPLLFKVTAFSEGFARVILHSNITKGTITWHNPLWLPEIKKKKKQRQMINMYLC